MLELAPATQALMDVLSRVTDDQLALPTPCTDSTVGDLIDHVDGLAMAFAAAAAKTPLPGGSQGRSAADASRLGDDWRERIPDRLAALAAAWRDPQAWTGMTKAGGRDLPGEVTGLVAIDEVVVHGWDIAVATGQSYTPDPALVAAARGFVDAAVARSPEGTSGLFGRPVPTAADASDLDQLLGLTGRDPAWITPAAP
jgi:uncharacterized protein (TIGR03086 family)